MDRGKARKPGSGREALLVAALALLLLTLVLVLVSRPLGLRPAALVGFPVAVLNSAAVVLILLVLIVPRSEPNSLH